MSVVLLATEMESMSESRCSAVPSSRRASLEQYSDRAPLLATIVQLSSLHHLLFFLAVSRQLGPVDAAASLYLSSTELSPPLEVPRSTSALPIQHGVSTTAVPG